MNHAIPQPLTKPRFATLRAIGPAQAMAINELDRSTRFIEHLEYDYQLVIDPDTGLVLSYGDDLWRAAATA